MFEQIKLPYDFNALEPAIDALTVETHYTKHHATYTKKLNDLAEKAGIQNQPIEEILAGWKSNQSNLENATAIRNNGGGFYSHNLYFGQLGPNAGGQLTGKLGDKIDETFGSYNDFVAQISDAAANQFGSGYAWLNSDTAGMLSISKTPNQDSPLLETEGKLCPIFCIDVWEHAYYLKYKNLRPDYIKAFFGVVNWEQVAKNYEAAQNR